MKNRTDTIVVIVFVVHDVFMGICETDALA